MSESAAALAQDAGDAVQRPRPELPVTTVTRVSLFAYIAASAPVASSFGVRHERGVVLLKIEDASGLAGWGEVWSGMPASGALHRLNLLREFVVPALIGMRVQSVAAAVAQLRRLLQPVVRLAGEPGPVAQVLGGVDTALWDLQSRRVGLPLYRVLGGTRASMRCYASGLAPDSSGAQIDVLRKQGFRAFKFKAGFNDDRTIGQLLQQRRTLAPRDVMMLDANGGWQLANAVQALDALADGDFAWVEEPLGPERPAAEWLQLKAGTTLPIAAGENMFNRRDFVAAMSWLDVIQPDLAKWGGVSGVMDTGRQAMDGGRLFCPHSFGTHVAAMASAHVLAATGGAGFVELDVNANPLRLSTVYADWINDGVLTLPEMPGLGFDVDVTALQPYLRDFHEKTAPAV